MYDIELKRKWDRANILAHAREQGEARGKAETEAKKNLEFVSNLLKDGRFTVEEIAKLANVPVAFVLKVRSEQNRTTK
jgi:predicted transposase YdaD